MRFYAIVLLFLTFVAVLIHESGQHEFVFFIAADAGTASLVQSYQWQPTHHRHQRHQPSGFSAKDASMR